MAANEDTFTPDRNILCGEPDSARATPNSTVLPESMLSPDVEVELNVPLPAQLTYGSSHLEQVELAEHPFREDGSTKKAPIHGIYGADEPLVKYELRRRRRAWIEDQLASGRAAGEPTPAHASEMQDEGFCWICARRGRFQICPQIASSNPNPRITIEDPVSAGHFATEISNPKWRPEEVRMVFYTDMSAKNGMGRNPSLAGAGITHRRMMDGEASEWLDASYGIIGSNRTDKIELYAIGLALEIAAGELKGISERICKSEKHGQFQASSVIIITDSQASLYFIHDYLLNGTTPPMFSRETFTSMMEPITNLKKLEATMYFHWAPAHTKIEGNCRADVLAGEASRWTSERCGSRKYQPSLDCEVIEIRDLTNRKVLRIPKKMPTKGGQTGMHVDRCSKRSLHNQLAKQIEGMQAEWVADELSKSYRPAPSRSTF